MAEAATASQRQQKKNNRRTMKLHFFSGVKKQDIMSVETFIKTFEREAGKSNLTDERMKCETFFQHLRGPAARMFINMEKMGDNVSNWELIKERYLNYYQKKESELKRIQQYADLDDEELAEEDLSENMIEQVNQCRAQQGKQPFKSNYPHARRTYYQAQYRCRFCQKTGHKQRYCYARMRARAPCVNEEGIPWSNQPKHQKDEEEEKKEEQLTEEGVRIASLSQPSLN